MWKNKLKSFKLISSILNSARKKPKIYLSGINYYIGELKDISHVDFLKTNNRELENYYSMGLKTYSESKLSMIEMARESIVKTLEDVNIVPEEIDVLLYIAESIGRDEIMSSNEVNKLLSSLGLNKTYPIGVCLSDCANILVGIEIAQCLLTSKQAKNVLVVCTNKSSSRQASRKITPEVAISSDAAVSAMVTFLKGDYLIMGSKRIKNHVSTDQNNPLDFSIKKSEDLQTITRLTLKDLNLKCQDFNRVYMNNYAELSPYFVKLCGFSPEKGFYNNIPKYSHCVAGDTLISLKDQKNFINYRDNIFAMADSKHVTCVMCLQSMLTQNKTQ